MTHQCIICKQDICDTYYWVVDDKELSGIWCATCHFNHREGVKDIPIWEDDEIENEKEEQ